MLIIAAWSIYKISRLPPKFEKLTEAQFVKYLQSPKVQSLNQKKLVELGTCWEKIAPEQRRNLLKNISEEERRNLWQNQRLVREAVLDKTIDEFFSLSPEKQEEFLDKQIQEMESRRPLRPEGWGRRDGQANSPVLGNTPGASQPETGLARGGPGGGRRARLTPEARLQRRRNMLSATTPEQRAKRREYFRRLMEKRRPRRS